MDLLLKIGDMWVRRRAKPDARALAAVKDLLPATVVTGASEGLGFELARRIAREGRAVVMVARGEELLSSAAYALRSETPQAKVVAQSLDVRDRDAASKLDALLAEHGLYLDVLVNNAGIGAGGAFADLDPHEIDALVDTNVAAVTRLTRHYLPAMKARARGGILNLASLAGFAPGPGQAPYFASKAYVLSLTAAIGAECSGSGVRVCALACGPVETRIHRKMKATNTYYRLLLPSFSAEHMARLAWQAYRMGRRVVVPGIFNAILALSMRAVPFDLMLPIVQWLMKPRTFISRRSTRRRPRHPAPGYPSTVTPQRAQSPQTCSSGHPWR